jgi:mannose-6-phosphate isomerase
MLRKKKVSKRPWGGFEQFTLNEISTVKILTVRPGKRFSLQYHKKRKEFWRFLDNPAKVTIGMKTRKMKKGDEVIVRTGQLHRIQALSKPVNVLEVSFGRFDEKDIVRVEDDFGRA